MKEEKRPNHRPEVNIKERMEEKKDSLEDDFYTIYELADILKLHHNTIRNNIKSGKLKAHKIGQQWRIKKSDILSMEE